MPTFARLHAFAPRVSKLRVAGIAALLEPRSTASTTRELAGFLGHATLWAHGTGDGSLCRALPDPKQEIAAIDCATSCSKRLVAIIRIPVAASALTSAAGVMLGAHLVFLLKSLMFRAAFRRGITGSSARHASALTPGEASPPPRPSHVDALETCSG